MDAVQRHRSMYKGTTPPWKETYRKVSIVFVRFFARESHKKLSTTVPGHITSVTFFRHYFHAIISNESHPVTLLYHHSH